MSGPVGWTFMSTILFMSTICYGNKTGTGGHKCPPYSL